jgi:site-specific recombinase XerD
MSKKRMEFPMEVQQGSVVVKIYRVKNKSYRHKTKDNAVKLTDRYGFMVSFFVGAKRQQKMFAKFDEAYAVAESKAKALSRGELDALEISAVGARIYVNCVDMAKETGLALELLVKDAVEALKFLGGKASLSEAAREYAKRNMHEVPSKLLPVAVEEMLKIKKTDGTSDAYQKVLKVYLNQLKKKFQCQLKTVTTGQLSEYFQELDVSPRSKNNARATVGAFFKFCKERGWLPRDHEGVSLVQKFKEKTSDIAIYSPWEVTQFLRFARTELVPFVAIGAFAGLRTAEIERLDWTEVHMKDRFIEIKASKAKTASRRIVPISNNLAKWLKDHVQEHGRVVPFENMAKQIGWLVEDANAGLKKAAEEAGKDPEKARTVKWKKNALRHSYISYRVAEIEDVAKVALEAGNSPQMIFQHYRELVRPKEAKTWFAINPKS